MNSEDSKLRTLQFNEYINNRDIRGLNCLLAEEIILIDKLGKVEMRKELIIQKYLCLRDEFPDYKKKSKS